MIKDVKVTDTRIDENTRRNIGNQLTAQISQHIEKGEYFKRVISFPAKLNERDVQLQFDFSSLKGKRTPHPGYFPGALLTLTIWIWVNGRYFFDGSLSMVMRLILGSALGRGQHGGLGARRGFSHAVAG